MSRTAVVLMSVVVVAVLVGIAVHQLESVNHGTGPSLPQVQGSLETSTSSSSQGKVTLRGSGATFPLPQIEAWIDEFMKDNPGVEVEYQGIGSGAGQEQFFKGLTDFCGSDPPLSRSKWEEYRGKVMQVPYILGAVVITYNLPGMNDVHLKLDGRTVALIYLGKIEYWDDPRIKELNPGIKLPHERITVVHRSDASGTTQIFTTFLHEAAPSLWPSDLVGKTVNWPVDETGRGVGGKGNPGVIAIVRTTDYSVGYVELAYALNEKLPVAALKNRDGRFVLPSKETIQAAASHALETGLIPTDPKEDFSRDIEAIIYAPGPNSYPLSAFSHLILWTHYPKDKAEVLAKFLQWICDKGDKYIVEGYVAAPDSIKTIIRKAASYLAG